jgi:hypothetical protein
MGPGELGVMIPIIGMMIGGFVIFSRSEIGHAFAHRLRGGPAQSGVLEDEVRELRGEVDQLRTELGEAQERLDFAERMLSAGKREG